MTNLYILFVAKEPDTQLNCHADGSLKSNKDSARWENAYVSIGIAMGLVMRAAASIGFSTGCNKSHNDLNGDDYWPKKLGIMDDIKNGTKEICYGLGIGYPREDKPRWESDETELMLGAANGSKITLTDQETHPRTGKQMRKAKIVDITKEKGQVKDPYGNTHNIPEKAEFKINSHRNRGIKIIEIK